MNFYAGRSRKVLQGRYSLKKLVAAHNRFYANASHTVPEGAIFRHKFQEKHPLWGSGSCWPAVPGGYPAGSRPPFGRIKRSANLFRFNRAVFHTLFGHVQGDVHLEDFATEWIGAEGALHALPVSQNEG